MVLECGDSTNYNNCTHIIYYSSKFGIEAQHEQDQGRDPENKHWPYFYFIHFKIRDLIENKIFKIVEIKYITEQHQGKCNSKNGQTSSINFFKIKIFECFPDFQMI